jgi:hypothetical protein
VSARFYDDKHKLGEYNFRLIPSNIEYTVVLGWVNGIGEVTLYKCIAHAQSSSTGDVIRCQYLLIGKHFTEEEMAFESVRFELTHLSDWFVGKSGISVTETDQIEPPQFIRTFA